MFAGSTSRCHCGLFCLGGWELRSEWQSVIGFRTQSSGDGRYVPSFIYCDYSSAIDNKQCSSDRNIGRERIALALVEVLQGGLPFLVAALPALLALRNRNGERA